MIVDRCRGMISMTLDVNYIQIGGFLVINITSLSNFHKVKHNIIFIFIIIIIIIIMIIIFKILFLMPGRQPIL